MEHQMNLHEDKPLFKQAIAATLGMMRIPEIFIEKDYWVTYALRAVFEDAIGKEVVFKGGTARAQILSAGIPLLLILFSHIP